jgi:hypothetical protein
MIAIIEQVLHLLAVGGVMMVILSQIIYDKWIK